MRLAFFPLTDLGNAERFRERYLDKLLWCPALGWLAWDAGLQANLPAAHPYAGGPPQAGVTGLRRPLGSGLRNRILIQ